MTLLTSPPFWTNQFHMEGAEPRSCSVVVRVMPTVIVVLRKVGTPHLARSLTSSSHQQQCNDNSHTLRDHPGSSSQHSSITQLETVEHHG